MLKRIVTLLCVLLVTGCPLRRLDTRTPLGVTVRSESRTPTDTELAAIDDGIEHTIEKAKCQGYKKGLDPSLYNVNLEEGVLAPDSGVPAIKTSCKQYCGTEWDLGGYILESGNMVNDYTIKLARVDGHDHDLYIAASNEIEHCILFRNDRAKFKATQTHLNGAGHPIIPACP